MGFNALFKSLLELGIKDTSSAIKFQKFVTNQRLKNTQHFQAHTKVHIYATSFKAVRDDFELLLTYVKFKLK